MSATVRQAGIRLSLQGAQEVTRGLREIGDAGERNLQRVTQEAGTASRALQLLGPLLGGLGAGLGIGSALGLAQSVLTDVGGRIVAMGRDVLGVGEAAETARRSAEEWMATLRDEGEAARRVIREVNDLLLTSAQRATNAANAQREAYRVETSRLLGNATARGEEAAIRLPDLDRQIAEERRILEQQRQIARQATSGPLGAPTDVDQVAGSRLAALEAQRNNLMAQLRQDAPVIEQLRENLRRLAGEQTPDEYGPTGDMFADARRRADRDARRGESEARRLARERQRNAEKEQRERERAVEQINSADQLANLRAAGMERAAPALQAYERTMEALNEGLRTGALTQEQFAQRVQLTSEALEGQIQQAMRAGQSVDQLARQTSRFAASAVGDFVRAAIAGKDLADTLSNILSRLGDLFLNSAFQRIFGGGSGGGGFDLFGWLGGAIFGGGGEALAGKRAMGGPVEAGRPYLVGERGPEVFVPRQSGGIVPNGQGGGAPVITQNFDFRGATVDEVKFRRIAREESQRAVGGLVEGRRESRSVLA